MLGFLFSIIAGAAMSLQGVMNTRLSDKVGIYESNLYCQGIAFVLSLAAYFIMGKNGFTALAAVPKQYMFGGVLGLVITITVMLGIKDLSPVVSISVILVSQLLVAALVEAIGALGTDKTGFSLLKAVGLVLMVAGIVVFKIKT
jgi:transporter family-2 protein